MKKIDTLVQDIKSRLTSSEPYDLERVREFAAGLAETVVEKLTRPPSDPTLRMSNLGTPCERKLWYAINRPQTALPLSASTRMKFLIGDIWEEVLLFLAAVSGHEVKHRQAKVKLEGVSGSIDAVIDGELVDSKSASTPSFGKFKKGITPATDDFGYLTQLDGYLTAGGDLVRNKERAHFLVGDKTLGHILLSTHERSNVDYGTLVAQKRQMLSFPTPPARAYSDVPDGASGNRMLGIACSYCPFKRECWPGLRVFAYSRSPRFLSTVRREPDVPELSWDEIEN